MRCLISTPKPGVEVVVYMEHIYLIYLMLETVNGGYRERRVMDGMSVTGRGKCL